MIQISLGKAELTVSGRERLTTGMSCVVRCRFTFSPEWEGLKKFAEFSDGVEARTVALTGDVCDIPHEVLTTAGRVVTVGVHGTDGKKVVLPSVFARLGEVEEGAQGDSDPSLPLTPSLFDQFVVRAEQAHADSLAAQEAREVVETYLSAEASAVMRRNIYRGKYLGGALKTYQLAAIRDGSFEDLYIGDYWRINGVVYRIADMNYWYNVSSPEGRKRNHLLIVPDQNLAYAPMMGSDTTQDGYWGSYMKQTALASVREKVFSAFGEENIFPHQEYFTSAVEDGRPVEALWRRTTLDLMSEIMVYGTNIFAVMNSGGTINWNYTTARWQLALFRLNPQHIDIPDEKSWLRDVADSARFTAIGSNGYAYCMKASFENGIRPVFAVG